MDQREQALLTLDRAADELRLSRTYHLRRARLLDQLGRATESDRERRIVAGLPPAGALDHFFIGTERYEQGNLSGAVESFNEVLAVEPGHFWARLFLAICYMHLDQPGHWSAARACLDACVCQQPDFVWLYVLRARASQELGLGDAEADVRTALKLNPTEDVRYFVLAQEGTSRFVHRDYAGAAARLQEAIALRPKEFSAHLSLASVFIAQADLESAAKEAERAVRLGAPTKALFSYYLERSRVAFQAHRLDEALRASDKASSLYPTIPEPLKIRAGVFLERADYDDAIAAYTHYLDRHGTERWEAYVGRGQAHMKRGHYGLARDDYSRAIDIRDAPELRVHRGWAYFFNDAWKDALTDFQRAVEMDPGPSGAYIGRGLTRVMLKKWFLGVADAELALARKPKSPEMLHNLACLFAQAAIQVEKEAGRPDGNALALEFRNQAVTMIGKCLDSLPAGQRRTFWLCQISRDQALEPIRGTKEYQALERHVSRTVQP
jgi:tetratricopeptide (TPR) repeat protein